MTTIGSAAEVIAHLGLAPHPEGGHYKEVLRGDAEEGGRSVVTSIHYLLQAGERSHWHRIDAYEVWHWNAGAPLLLSMSGADGEIQEHLLGGDIVAGQIPQATVPPGDWQSAVSTGGWSLVGCTVAPGFDFAGFELAPPGWTPKG